MGGSAQQNGFDGRQLAKLLALLDSPIDAEAAGATHKIRVVLKKHGLKFYEAIEHPDYKTGIWENFGHPECLKSYFERGNTGQLEEQIKALQAELTQREHDGARLAEALTTARQEVAQLRRSAGAAPAPRLAPAQAGPVSGGLVALVVLVAVALMIAAACQ